jgi:hypothetical protein
MRTNALLGGLILLSSVSACGGSDDDAPVGGGLTCAPSELRVKGKLDGVDVSLVRPTNGYAFINKLSADSLGTLDVATEQGSLSLEFNMLTANGDSSPARGSLVDAEGSLSVGNCESGDFASTIAIDADGDGVHFTLRSLHREPYCTGAAASGQLDGCVHQSAR